MHKPLTKKQIKKLNKQTTEKYSPDLDFIILLQDVTDPINVGSFFRIADAFGISKIILTNNAPTPPDPNISLTSRGLERSVDWEYFEFTEIALSKLRKEGYSIIAVELSESSVDYSDYDYSEKTCFILGNEASGVYKNILELCDAVVHIPMFGKGPSLNVNVAGAIVISEAISKFKTL